MPVQPCRRQPVPQRGLVGDRVVEDQRATLCPEEPKRPAALIFKGLIWVGRLVVVAQEPREIGGRRAVLEADEEQATRVVFCTQVGIFLG